MEPWTLLYDGACPLCRAGPKWAIRLSRAGRIRPVPFDAAREDPALAGLVGDTIPDGFILRTPDGAVFCGADAIPELLRATGTLSLLAPLLRLPPFSWILPPAYRWLAANRQRVSRRLFGCGTEACRSGK
ncbi:MAG TPA: DUF393 domain-containing protein [Candidatus Hydrogenedentes bacterium]|nr:DUF393 domain-containing protein [Candidatus Hydrogenedentota bacterium]